MSCVIFAEDSAVPQYLAWILRSDVVVEVDEAEGLYNWRSVVVRGKLCLLRARGPIAASERSERGRVRSESAGSYNSPLAPVHKMLLSRNSFVQRFRVSR
jgi:nitroimidazol reductase NimA-like FMN-containing flavoprotein (pyridoxamine 5'-phosphate oxidase superfamily)